MRVSTSCASFYQYREKVCILLSPYNFSPDPFDELAIMRSLNINPNVDFLCILMVVEQWALTSQCMLYIVSAIKVIISATSFNEMIFSLYNMRSIGRARGDS